ncbi:MAG: DUF697 domain-containing protein [Leptospiraceae bacterium]|nr:DUF697 domain-containing protein [Leptospiraceae bacterium]
MTETKQTSTDEIIKNHALLSMAAAAIPVPIADIAAITLVQLDMIKKLASHHSVNYDHEWGKSVVSSLTSSSLAVIASRFLASGIKMIPGVGTILGIATQVVLAGATTYALGRIFDEHFSGKEIIEPNLDMLKKKYEEYVEKGKKIVSEWKESQTSQEDVYSELEKLSKLKEMGAISPEEFEEAKKKLLGKI